MHNELYERNMMLKKKFIDVIKMNWYKYNNLSSYEELLENFRNKLNLLNKDILIYWRCLYLWAPWSKFLIIRGFHLLPIKLTVVATEHSGNFSF